MFLKEDEVLKR